MNARTSTTIFLITQAKTQLFLLAPAILYAYVCGMKKILNMQIKLLFIFILYKGIYPIILNAPLHIKQKYLPHHIKHSPSY